jgi:hypothetical protein
MPNTRLMTNYPNGFAQGVSVRGLPLLQTNAGNVFFLGNSRILRSGGVVSSDTNPGTLTKPLRTLSAALTACTQGAGDIIMVLPGHREAISSATVAALNVAGVAIVGLGYGSSRPTFVFDTATTANLPLRAANMSIQNCVFVANFAAVASYITAAYATATTSTIATAANSLSSVPTLNVVAVGTGTFYPGMALSGTGVLPGTIIMRQLTGTTGGIGTYEVSLDQTVSSTTITGCTTDFAIENCEFRDTTSALNALTVFTASAGANCCDGFYFVGNKVSSLGTTAATTAIKTTVAIDRLTICDNFGCSAVLNDTAALLSAGAAQLTNFELARNKWERPSTSSTGGTIVSGTGNAWTGMAYDNYWFGADATSQIWISTGHGTAFGYNQNYIPTAGAQDVSGTLNPAAA